MDDQNHSELPVKGGIPAGSRSRSRSQFLGIFWGGLSLPSLSAAPQELQRRSCRFSALSESLFRREGHDGRALLAARGSGPGTGDTSAARWGRWVDESAKRTAFPQPPSARRGAGQDLPRYPGRGGSSAPTQGASSSSRRTQRCPLRAPRAPARPPWEPRCARG